jgi:hypothetical protein
MTRIAKLQYFADRLEQLKIACLKEAATIGVAEKAIIPVTQKVIADLQRRFKTEGVSRMQLLHEFDIKESTDGEYYYVISIYGLMCSNNMYGRCGVVTVQTNYYNEGDLVTTALKLTLGGDDTVTVESGSPVGVITKALNYITKQVKAGNGFDKWVANYVSSKDKKKTPKKVVR